MNKKVLIPVIIIGLLLIGGVAYLSMSLQKEKQANKEMQELAEMDKAGYENYIELGPNKVLTGLVRKTLKDVNFANVENAKTLEKALELFK